MMGLTVCGGMVGKLSFLSARKGSSYPGYENWLTAFSIFTLSVNILVTTLICWKIWRIGKEIPPGLETSSRRYHSIMHALIESGGIYSVAQILYTVFRLFKVSIGVTFMMHVLPQVVGIAPTLIVIRLHSLSLLQPYDTGSPPPQQLQSLRKVTCEGVFVKPPNLPESHNPSETQHDPEGRSVQVTIISVI
ncbi:hypothetical protein FRC02_002483 [Tulasnella sp. 418]|nr:hypothetical protein FRC02_002483 [Tulasnella sp. 418]